MRALVPATLARGRGRTSSRILLHATTGPLAVLALSEVGFVRRLEPRDRRHRRNRGRYAFFSGGGVDRDGA
jgi:hypothetical protein